MTLKEVSKYINIDLDILNNMEVDVLERIFGLCMYEFSPAFIKHCCINNTFDAYQYQQIEEGIEYGLEEKYLKIYANPAFNEFQMEQIRLGLEYLSYLPKKKLKLIKLYAKPEFNDEQMEQIRYAIEFDDLISEEDILIFAKPEINSEDMKKMLKKILKENRIKKYGDTPEEDYYWDDED